MTDEQKAALQKIIPMTRGETRSALESLLAASAPTPSDKQEAVAYLSTEPRKWDQCRIKPQGSFTIPVFTHAERNEPLTDEEIEEISHQRETWSVIEFARAILAAAPLANPSDKQEAAIYHPALGGVANSANAANRALAQSAEQDRIDAELFQRLLHARSELGRTIADPMWADHGEVTKAALKRWHSAIDEVIKGASK